MAKDAATMLNRAMARVFMFSLSKQVTSDGVCDRADALSLN
jgi:hypothetical protein